MCSCPVQLLASRNLKKSFKQCAEKLNRKLSSTDTLFTHKQEKGKEKEGQPITFTKYYWRGIPLYYTLLYYTLLHATLLMHGRWAQHRGQACADRELDELDTGRGLLHPAGGHR